MKLLLYHLYHSEHPWWAKVTRKVSGATAYIPPESQPFIANSSIPSHLSAGAVRYVGAVITG